MLLLYFGLQKCRSSKVSQTLASACKHLQKRKKSFISAKGLTIFSLWSYLIIWITLVAYFILPLSLFLSFIRFQSCIVVIALWHSPCIYNVFHITLNVSSLYFFFFQSYGWRVHVARFFNCEFSEHFIMIQFFFLLDLVVVFRLFVSFTAENCFFVVFSFSFYFSLCFIKT